MKLIHVLIQLITIYVLTVTAKIYEIDGYKYYLSYPLKKNWYGAQRFCTYHGMSLIDIPNEEENNRIIQIITMFDGNRTIADFNIWTSGIELGSEGEYYWQTTGHPMLYKAWYPGEPTNSDNKEDCLLLFVPYKHGWVDANCLTEQNFICRDKLYVADTMKNKQTSCVIRQ